MYAVDVKPGWRAVPFGIYGVTLAFVLASSAPQERFDPAGHPGARGLQCRHESLDLHPTLGMTVT